MRILSNVALNKLFCFFSIYFLGIVGGETSYAREIKVWVAAGEAGIYSSKLDTEKGRLESAEAVVENLHSMYIAKHPKLNVLYSINRSNAGGSVTSYLIDSDGGLTLQSEVNFQPKGGIHVSLSPNGRFLAAAYYRGGAVSVYELDDVGAIKGVFSTSMHLGKGEQVRQKSPHPHWTGFDASSSLIYVPDLGNDYIWIHALDESNRRLSLYQKVASPKGFGPRHMAFHSELAIAYVSDELVSHVSRYRLEPKSGRLKYIDSQESAEENKKELWHSVSDIRIHPNGRFLYVVNRGFDRVSIFKIDQSSGELEFVESEPVRGSMSRNIAFSPEGRWALITGQASNTLTLFKVDAHSGELQYVREIIGIPSAMAIVIGD